MNELILVAEDSPTQALLLKTLLQGNNFSVVLAEDGQIACEWLMKNTPALVISDIMMPNMNGYELCKRIKSDIVTEDVPVILLTSLSGPEEVIEGLSCGADSFITKPYNEEFLLSSIRKIIGDSNENSAAKKVLGLEITFQGKRRLIHADPQNLINLMVSIYQGAMQQNEELQQTRDKLWDLNESLESLVQERTRELEHELADRKQLMDDLVVARKKAEESDRLKSAFLANISHEIRTPLNSIIGFSDLLNEEENKAEDVIKYSSIIRASGNRLLQLISNLIDVSKIESGTEVVNISEVLVINAVREVCIQFHLIAGQNDIEIVEIIPEETETLILRTDSLKLHQVLTNLLNNALKFTQSGHIDVGIERHTQGVLFFVRDTGIGIPSDQLDLVFDRFRQINTKIVKSAKGAGLGLSLCKGIVELLGGKIWVESEEGKGSTFFFLIPDGQEAGPV